MPKRPPEHRIKIAVYLDPAQLKALRELSEVTRVPWAEYIRAGVNHVLKRERRKR